MTFDIKHYKEEVKRHTVPAFGNELLREVILPDIFGKEYEGILYWAGKNLARKYPITSNEELIFFFLDCGWGKLELQKEKTTELTFELTGTLVDKRLKHIDNSSFHLEAGFLAMQLENQIGKLTEAYVQKKRMKRKVLFTLKSE